MLRYNELTFQYSTETDCFSFPATTIDSSLAKNFSVSAKQDKTADQYFIIIMALEKFVPPRSIIRICNTGGNFIATNQGLT